MLTALQNDFPRLCNSRKRNDSVLDVLHPTTSTFLVALAHTPKSRWECRCSHVYVLVYLFLKLPSVCFVCAIVQDHANTPKGTEEKTISLFSIGQILFFLRLLFFAIFSILEICHAIYSRRDLYTP